MYFFQNHVINFIQNVFHPLDAVIYLEIRKKISQEIKLELLSSRITKETKMWISMISKLNFFIYLQEVIRLKNKNFPLRKML